MAYMNKKTEQHAFKQIEVDLKGDKIANVVLLCGPEKYLVKFYADRLIKKYVNPVTEAMDLVTIEGDSLNVDSIMEACETMSFMSERKVVFVPDFTPADGKNVRGISDKDIDRLADYLAQVPETTLLMFTSGEVEGGKKAPKARAAVGAYGKVYDFQPLDDGMLRGFIDKRLRATGRQYRPSVVNAFVSESGYGNKYVEYTLYNLDNDLRKLAAYSVGPEITVEDVRAVITSNPENNIFALLDAVGQNRKGDALLMVHNLFDAKMNGFLIQSMIIGQLELVLMAKELTEAGYGLRDVCKMTNNKSEFKVKKAIAMGRKYSIASLKHILTGAYAIDRNVKTGTFEVELAIEYFISSI
ncbi:MAG: DNA polymerase III subunit delta [Eubacterium sp.]|nr:DNA polymerase III subunit delta [Candidatus Colimonas fimequi]